MKSDDEKVREIVEAFKPLAMNRPLDEEAHRLIGLSHAYAHAIVRLKNEIGRRVGNYAPRIPKHHTRKLAAREEVVRPLREMKDWLTEQHACAQEAYRKRSGALPTGE